VLLKVDHRILAVLAFLGGALTTAQIHSLSEASKPYTPTRLEWLALEMEARSREELSVPNPDTSYFYQQTFSMDFAAIQNEDAILILVRYVPSVDVYPELRKHMDQRITNTRSEVCKWANAFGISTCPKIIMSVKMIDVPSPAK
jgi:hypothetical protein